MCGVERMSIGYWKHLRVSVLQSDVSILEYHTPGVDIYVGVLPAVVLVKEKHHGIIILIVKIFLIGERCAVGAFIFAFDEKSIVDKRHLDYLFAVLVVDFHKDVLLALVLHETAHGEMGHGRTHIDHSGSVLITWKIDAGSTGIYVIRTIGEPLGGIVDK